MKLRNRLILDFILFALIWVVMSYDFTGGFLHALLAGLLILAFIVHIFVNRRYYVLMSQKIFASEALRAKQFISYIVNVVMLLSVFCMLLSSLAISRDLVPAISNLFGNYSFWRTTHIVSAVSIVVCMLLHIFLHAKLFDSIVRKQLDSERVTTMMRLASGAIALCIVLGVIRVCSQNIQYIYAHGESQPYNNVEEQSLVIKSKDDEDDVKLSEDLADEDSATISENVDDEEQPSLNDYLGKLHCNGCGRHCSLLSPACGKGARKAQEATQEYYSLYSGE